MMDITLFYDNPELDTFTLLKNITKQYLFIFLDNESNLSKFYDCEIKNLTLPLSMLYNIQSKLEEMINTNYDLYNLGREAYKSFIKEYANSSLNIDNKRDAESLDISKICFQFGFSIPLFISVK